MRKNIHSVPYAHQHTHMNASDSKEFEILFRLKYRQKREIATENSRSIEGTQMLLMLISETDHDKKLYRHEVCYVPFLH